MLKRPAAKQSSNHSEMFSVKLWNLIDWTRWNPLAQGLMSLR